MCILPPPPPPPHMTAHARLMMHDEVSVQDAVVAVSLMESSMQVSTCSENITQNTSL